MRQLKLQASEMLSSFLEPQMDEWLWDFTTHLRIQVQVLEVKPKLLGILLLQNTVSTSATYVLGVL